MGGLTEQLAQYIELIVLCLVFGGIAGFILGYGVRDQMSRRRRQRRWQMPS